jgi:hypothetical protein
MYATVNYLVCPPIDRESLLVSGYPYMPSTPSDDLSRCGTFQRVGLVEVCSLPQLYDIRCRLLVVGSVVRNTTYS